MAIPHDTTRMNESVRSLRDSGVVPAVSARLRGTSSEHCLAAKRSIVREVLAFTATGNPDVRPELAQHLSFHANEICSLLAGHPLGDLAFVSQHARRRAEQKFPLDAVLASYRCLHRDVMRWIHDAAVESADESAQLRRVVAAVNAFSTEYSGIISSLMTSEYVAQTRVAAEAEGDRRTELLRILLSGYDESDGHAAQLLRRAGYLEQRQSFCIAVARSVDPREMESTARAQRMADAVANALRNLPIRVLIGIRDNLVTVVLSGTRRTSGWTVPQSLLAERIYPHLRTIGTAALIGVSTDAPSTSHIPAALDEAKLALDFANVAERIMPFARIPFRSMLVGVAADRMQTALPPWTSAFLAADHKAKGTLTTTLRAYADADMNAQKTAKALSIHPNTIYARMQRIEDITSRNPLSYNALTELLLATECAKLSS